MHAGREILRGHHVTHERRGIGTDDAQSGGEDDEERHDGHQAENLRQDEVGSRVDAHDVEGIDLLRHAHRAELRGNVRPDLTREDQTHDRRGELEEHDLTRHIARHPMRHPRTLDVDLHLNAYHGSDEETDEQHDADGVDTELRHLLDIAFGKHAQALWNGERAPHEHEIASESRQIAMQ